MVGLFNAGARTDRPAVVHNRVLTAANGITLLRLLGLPLFVYLAVIGAYGRAFAALVLVGVTDWVDGYVARRFDQVTRIGTLIDPLIDRALLATAAVTMLILALIPWWVPTFIIVRDVVILGAAFLLFRRTNPNIPVSKLGKFATASLLIGVPAFLLAHPTADWPGARLATVVAYGGSIVGLVAYYVAAWRYGRTAVRVRRTLREARATEGPR